MNVQMLSIRIEAGSPSVQDQRLSAFQVCSLPKLERVLLPSALLEELLTATLLKEVLEGRAAVLETSSGLLLVRILAVVEPCAEFC